MTPNTRGPFGASSDVCAVSLTVHRHDVMSSRLAPPTASRHVRAMALPTSAPKPLVDRRGFWTEGQWPERVGLLCVLRPPRNYQIWLGRHSLFEDEDTVQYFWVTHSFPHPDFNLSLLENHTRLPGEDYSHDLMLLRLALSAQITDAVKVLALPTQEPVLGSTCYASGWGCIEPDKLMYPDELQCVDLRLLSNDMCAETFSKTVTESMSCAGHLEVGKETCLTRPLCPSRVMGSLPVHRVLRSGCVLTSLRVGITSMCLLNCGFLTSWLGT
ncbi:kallikrein-1-like [Diceros bicornis minor]|uniref:kallikrein-1-like n=1 Tax=Diceros bicornis minor TaxID=77932 RepID=UPI0026EE0A4F|nr:kallikrein-1-like [Diceros bicornis minor]